jgi:hypothetical protein
MRWHLLCAAVLLNLGCSATAPTARTHHTRSALDTRVRELPPESVPVELPPAAPPVATAPDPWSDPLATLDAAATRAQPGARRVLETIHTMIADAVVVRGSCYTWTNAVYRRAGGHRHTVFEGDRRASFAATSTLAPGDWVFFINHSFGDVTHSAIFVAWIDEAARTAMMVSYPGGNRNAPGRFSDYELSNVYQIVRMGDALDATPTPRRGSHRAHH